MSPAAFLEHGDEIVRSVPLRRVYLVKLWRKLKSVLTAPALAHVCEWAFINQ